MSQVVKLTTLGGKPVEFVDELIGQGGMKDVYFSPDKTYVLAFFRDTQDYNQQQRLRDIVGTYREKIFNQSGADYWRTVFCWPEAIVEHKGRIGVVVPAYQKNFFFKIGSFNNDSLKIRGKEKQGKWFTSPTNRNKFLAPEERGNWLRYLQVCLDISRAVRRLHSAGLAHSDLSYKNVLVAPAGEPRGRACLIDIDGLVVPGKHLPDVVGTPDFIAPEVIATQNLDKLDPNRRLPSSLTDRHALAVLIYQYLLCRHPLKGSAVHDMDPVKDEELHMGVKALFVEHPTDRGNRVKSDQVRKTDLPWGDPSKMPCKIAGPYLADLFQRAFVDGLHKPDLRPIPNDWETALIKTADMVQPCRNARCEMGWYVFDNTTRPTCPFCNTPYTGLLPVLNLYSSRTASSFKPDNHRVMVWNEQSLYPWHVNRKVVPNEHLTEAQRKRVGYFQLHEGQWYLVNQGMPRMRDAATKQDLPIGSQVKLVDGATLILDTEDGGRLIQVQMVGG